jgi:hypothetical protein
MFHFAAGRKTFSLKTAHATPLDKEEEAIGLDDRDGDELIDPQQKFGVTSGQKGKDTKRNGPDNPGDPAVRKAHELNEDIAKAKRVAAFFRISLKPFLVSNVLVLIVEPEGVVNPCACENIMWYPGSGIVERKKLEYMDAHPNIHAYSGLCASSDTAPIFEGTID